MLSLYYTNLQSNTEKAKFIDECCAKCKVRYPTVRTWILKPSSPNHRNPKPIYRSILAEITGMPEDKLFRGQ
jgi:hypothetical protein